MMRPAVFIDRDGTINEQRGYINHISRFVLLPGVGEAISLLNKNNHIVVITSNQSGVARGTSHTIGKRDPRVNEVEIDKR